MNPYASFQLPNAFKPFLGEPRTVQALQQHWLHGCEQVQQSWMRSSRGLFGHYDALLREGKYLQDSVLARYFEWVRDWTGAPLARPSAAEKPARRTTLRPTGPVQQVCVKDDLTRIRGVGRVVQQRLKHVGVVSFQQIATWTDTEIAYIENNVLGGAFAGCVSRDQWQAQARAFLEDA